ncbi:hypothetical protein L1887_34513 [Cichorium endivia]|nr:hypothetical protein L1887_34513 [Cichorium endivia]
MLVGSRADLLTLRSVRTEDAKTFADRENIHLFMEVSALDSLNVDNAFTILLTRIYHAANERTLKEQADIVPKGYKREYYGIPGKLEFLHASGSRYSQDSVSISELPRLTSNNFSIWKTRMIAFLNFFDNKMLEIIKEGRHTPPKERDKWSYEDKEKADLDYTAMHILTKYLKLKDKMKKSSVAKELNWAEISSDDEDDHE